MTDSQRIDQIEARLAYVEQLVASLSPGERKIIRDAPFTGVIAAVAHGTGIPVRDIIGPDRTQRACRARHAVCWIMNSAHPDYSSIRIGELLGGRDHSTVLNSIKQAGKLRSKDTAFRLLTDNLLTNAAERPAQ